MHIVFCAMLQIFILFCVTFQNIMLHYFMFLVLSNNISFHICKTRREDGGSRHNENLKHCSIFCAPNVAHNTNKGSFIYCITYAVVGGGE